MSGVVIDEEGGANSTVRIATLPTPRVRVVKIAAGFGDVAIHVEDRGTADLLL